MSYIEKLKEWQLWVHYVVLETIIVLFFHLNAQYWIYSNIINLIVLYLVIALGDQAIHFIIYKLTGRED